jgi:predicted nucleotidyltransferase
VKIPTIDQRTRIPRSAIEDVVSQIIEKFHPRQIILFGSYASGTPQPESDVDLLVILDTHLREAEKAYQICRDLDYAFGLDLLVITPERLKQRLAWGDTFLHEITQGGEVLYESSDA